MNHYSRIIIAFSSLVALLFSACTKEPDPTTTDDPSSHYDLLVLNEGLWGTNDGSISAINTAEGTVAADLFSSANGRGLGDLAQDAARYGNKLYVVVFGSNTLEVCNPSTLSSIRQISFAGRSPRYIVFHEDKAYVSCYNKHIYQVDTASLTIVDSCRLSGMQPETMCILGTKLYVVNSWQYDANGSPEYDNTLSVVDLVSFQEERKITVGLNPFKVMPVDNSHLLVGYAGNYGSQPSGVEIINLADDSRTDLNTPASGFDICNGYLYTYSFSYTTGQAEYWKTDLSTLSKTQLPIGSGVKTAYGIKVDPSTGDIYLTDSQQFRSNGDVRCYSASGTLKWILEVGKGPSKVIIL